VSIEQPEHVDATFFAVVQPIWSRYVTQDGKPILEGAKVDRITQTRPRRDVAAGSVVTRIILRLDADALLPLQPEAVIHVHAGQVETIQVAAVDPDYPED
jgi:hypothetical protein